MKTIPILNNKGEVVAHAIVDDCDYEELLKYKWSLSSEGYVRRTILRSGSHKLYMSHQLLGRPENRRNIVIHKNGNKMDYRRENLALTTVKKNAPLNRKTSSKTSSKYKGVCWDKQTEMWVAYIGIRKKRKTLGRFEVEEDAARRRDSEVIEIYGRKNVFLNFPSV